MSLALQDFLRDNPLTESLVLSLHHEDKTRRVLLTYDYAAEQVSRYFQQRLQEDETEDTPSGYYRDFRRIVFDGVFEYRISRNRSTGIGVVEYELQHRMTHPGVVVVETHISRSLSQYRITITLSEDSVVTIGFASAPVERRIARAEKVSDGSWGYFDARSGERIDFYAPFDTKRKT